MSAVCPNLSPHHCWWVQTGAGGFRSPGGTQNAPPPALSFHCRFSRWPHPPTAGSSWSGSPSGPCMQKHKQWQTYQTRCTLSKFFNRNALNKYLKPGDQSADSHTDNISAVRASRSCTSSGRDSSSPTCSFFCIYQNKCWRRRNGSVF